MVIHPIRTMVAIFLVSMACNALAAPAASGPRDRVIMGGSTLGLRNSAPQDIEITFNTALNDLRGNTGTVANFAVFPTTDALYAAFDKGEVDGIFGTAIEYLGREQHLAKEKMALVFKNTAVKQSLVLLARKDESVGHVKDLRNKRLTLARYQDLEEVYLNTLLLRNRLPEISGFFAARLDAKSPNVAIMDIFFGKTDATIVRETEYLTAVELNPQLGNKLVVVERSPPYLPTLGSVRKELAGERIDNLMRSLRTIGDTEKGRKVLSFSNAKAIESVTDADLQSVRDLVHEYQVLKMPKNTGASVPATRGGAGRNAQ